MDPTSNLRDLHLPLSSLRLFVSPICLMSASMWQVAQLRNVKQYGKLEEFVTLVTESVPELLTFRQRTQLILGLRARLVLEFCQSELSLDPQTIQHHLDRIHLCTETFNKNEDKAEEVKQSMSNFVELVQTLLKDPTEREHFFKVVFPVHYGPLYDTALQILMWEFFSRLEELLPVPSFSQTASCLSFIESDLKDCEELFADPEPLKTLLQHQRSKGQLDTSQFSFNSDTIMTTLSLVQDEYITNNLNKVMGGEREAESQRENVYKGIKEREQVDNDVNEGMNEDTEAGESHSKQQLHDSSPQASPLPPSVTNNETVGMAGEARTMPPNIMDSMAGELRTEPPNRQADDAHSLVFTCPHCPFSYMTDKQLQHHIKKQHLENGNMIVDSGSQSPVPTSTAPTGFSTKRTKLLHTCTLCQKSFTRSFDLKRHQSVHSDVPRFPCNQCDKRFKTKDGLKAHKQTHTDEKLYVCSPTSSTAPPTVMGGEREAKSQRENVYKGIKEWEQLNNDVNEGMNKDTEAGDSHSKQQLHDSSPQASPLSPSVTNNETVGMAGEARTMPPNIMDSMAGELRTEPPNRQADDAHSLVFTCPHCPFSYMTDKQLQHHIKKQHLENGNMIVDSGSQSSVPTSTSPTGFSTKRTKLLHTCTLCQKSFTRSFDFKRHQSVHSDVPQFPCNQCDKRFKTKDGLRIHKRTHTDEKPYVCSPTTSTAPTGFSTKATKMLHTCTLCQKSFARSFYLKRHQSVHSVLQCPCNQCDKRLNNKCDLRVHKQIHTCDKPYLCSHCGRAFREICHLKSHQHTHTGERPFVCSLCDKKFIQKQLLTHHQRTHTGDRPYLCSVCGKTFCASSALRIHSRLHTGERPYHCDYCGRNYITLQRLKTHQRFHTGERPYPCKLCEKCFHTRSGLNKHIRTHTGEKPYQCPKCGKTFSENGNMKIHLRSHRS